MNFIFSIYIPNDRPFPHNSLNAICRLEEIVGGNVNFIQQCSGLLEIVIIRESITLISQVVDSSTYKAGPC